MQVPQLKLDGEASNLCFGCSKDNPIGMKLKFLEADGIHRSEFTPGQFHQGWSGLTHGGVLFTLLDEAAGYAVLSTGVTCVTAKSEIKFSCLSPINEPLQISAWVTRNTSRIIETKSTLTLMNGTVIAENSSSWYVIRKSKVTEQS